MLGYKIRCIYEKKKKIYTICFILLIIFIVLFTGYFTHQKYDIYNNFERVNMIKDITANRNLHEHFNAINKHVKFCDNHDHFSKGDLIYNFKKYDLIPILKFLNNEEEDIDLFNSFNGILEFTEFYTNKQFNNINELFVNYYQTNYHTFNPLDSRYFYNIKKNVITKKEFNKLYFDYKKCNNVDEIFVNMIYKDLNLSKSEVKRRLSDYDSFYNKYKDVIIRNISYDLYYFGLYLYDNRDDFNIVGEDISLTYVLRKTQKVSYGNSKYNNWVYTIDLDSIWDSLDKMGYPMLYM